MARRTTGDRLDRGRPILEQLDAHVAASVRYLAEFADRCGEERAAAAGWTLTRGLRVRRGCAGTFEGRCVAASSS